MLVDSFGRSINYLRLGVTDKCNLRCFYCMPESGIDWLKRTELLSYEELYYLCRILTKMGIEKIRITGGEPFVRNDIMKLLHALSKLAGLQELTITTNGVLTADLVPELKAIGIKSVNLSIDSLDRARFTNITKRDELAAVLRTLEQLQRHGIAIKINAVVMENKNIADIVPLTQLSKDLGIDVRFIEEMPFNGAGQHYSSLTWDHTRILNYLKEYYPNIHKIADPPYSTSYNYEIPGHRGKIGIIAAYTRLFCGTCNRIRITPNGTLKTCLYDNGVINLRSIIRDKKDDLLVEQLILQAIAKKHENGWQAEKSRNNNEPVHESMATIGG